MSYQDLKLWIQRNKTSIFICVGLSLLITPGTIALLTVKKVKADHANVKSQIQIHEKVLVNIVDGSLPLYKEDRNQETPGVPFSQYILNQFDALRGRLNKISPEASPQPTPQSTTFEIKTPNQ